MPTPDGWTLAPSGWEYRRVMGTGDYWCDQHRPPCAGRAESVEVMLYGLTDDDIPPCDRELVRSLWEAKDG